MTIEQKNWISFLYRIGVSPNDENLVVRSPAKYKGRDNHYTKSYTKQDRTHFLGARLKTNKSNKCEKHGEIRNLTYRLV